VTDIGSSSFPTANISSVAIGGSEDTLLVTFSNYGVSSVWQSFNGGNDWLECEGNLPDMPIRWAIFHPQNSAQAMIATETGIWTTNTLHEAQTEWLPAADGLGHVRVDMLRLREADNKVIAASHGRGVFTANWNVDIYTGQPEQSLAGNIRAFPNPATDVLTLSFPNQPGGLMNYTIFSMDGRMLQAPTKIRPDNGNTRIPVASLPAGTYVVQLQSATQSHSIRFVKQ
jgi:hypothetical protein